MLRNSQHTAALHSRRRSVQAARLRASCARATEERRSIPVALIRAGTSRGVFVLRQHLPSHPIEREAAILRLFGAQGGHLSDGLGGERPAMRKLAIVERLPDAPDGTPVLAYTFGQVDAELRRVDFSGECGNVAAGVPLFASLFGWCAAPGSGGSAWLHLTNTGKRVLTTWSAGDRHGGTVQLEFVTPVLAGASVLPHGVPQRVTERPGGGTIRHSVVHALNRYVFIDSRDLGIADPVAADVTEALFDEVRLVLASIAAHRPGTPPKVCLVAPAAGREGTVRARILYPDGRWSHPGFAVTGAVTLAVGCCLEGSVLAPCRGAHHINIEHPGGTLAVRWTPGDGGLPASVSLRRDVRLLLRGAAF